MLALRYIGLGLMGTVKVACFLILFALHILTLGLILVSTIMRLTNV